MMAALLAILLLLVAGPAAAEGLIVTLSSHRIVIGSNFTGTEITAFGSVTRDAATVSRAGQYDIVVVARGPARATVVRRKENVAGVWVNLDSRDFPEAPSMLAIRSSRPLAEITSPQIARRFGLTLESAAPRPGAPGNPLPNPGDSDYRQALVRLKSAQGLWSEAGTGVTFLGGTLFQSTLRIPDNVPFGDFEVDVYLFADGVMLSRTTSAFEVVKFGFEASVADAARERPLLYGVASALLAVIIGWIASVAFRRD